MAALLCHVSQSCETGMWLLLEHLKNQAKPCWAHKQCPVFTESCWVQVQLHLIEDQMGKNKNKSKLLYNKEDAIDSQVSEPLKSFYCKY